MKQVKISLLIILLISLPLKIEAQLNKFMVQTYFEEGQHTEVVPTPPWRSSDVSIRMSYFIGLKNLNFNNIQIDNLSEWKKPRNYVEKYIMANYAGLSTIIINDSLYSKYDEFGKYYHSSPFNYDKATAQLDKLLSNDDYDIIGFNFTDEPRTAFEQDSDVIEFIPPYSNIVKQRNGNLLRYANLSSFIPQSARYNREDYIQKYIDIVDPNLLSFDHHPAIYQSTYNCFFESLYHFGMKSVENSIPLLYTLMPFKDSIQFHAITQQGYETNLARSLPMFNYLIYASLAYGAKGISYWPGFQWVMNCGNWDFKLKFDTGVIDGVSSLHKKLIDHSNTLLSLNFASAYHRSFNSTIGIQFGKTVEQMYDFNSWDSIVNDKYAQAIFIDPGNCIIDADLNYNHIPAEIVVSFMTNSNGKIYFWVYNKSLTKTQHLGFVPISNDNFFDVLNDSIIYNQDPINNGNYPMFYLNPGEAKLITSCSNTSNLINESITNFTYNGSIPSSVEQCYKYDEDHLYPFESANEITLGTNVIFMPKSTKSFMANQITLTPGVSIYQGSTVRLSSFKNSNDTSVTLLRSAKAQEEERPSKEIVSKPILYPNPTRDFFKVKAYLSEKDEIEIKVYNNMGRLVKVEKSRSDDTSISLQNQPEGLYNVHITLNNKAYRYKVVKI